MVRYFYSWIPAGGLFVVLLLVVPFLGPIVALALAVGAVAALGLLVWKAAAAFATSVAYVVHHRPRGLGRPLAHRAGLAVQAHAAPVLHVRRS